MTRAAVSIELGSALENDLCIGSLPYGMNAPRLVQIAREVDIPIKFINDDHQTLLL